MSKCVEKLPHEGCATGGRGSLQVFQEDDGRYTGFCYSCNTFVGNPYSDKPDGYVPAVTVKSDEEIKEEISDIQDYKMAGFDDRKIKLAAMEYYGVKVGLDTGDGVTPYSHHFPYLNGSELRAYKNRLVGSKTMWSVGDMKDVDMFGWKQAIATGSPTLYITEGEWDALALWQMIMRQQHGTQYADRMPAVVSLSKGVSGATKDITRHIQEIRQRFQKVVLVFDDDEPGHQGVEAVSIIAPEFTVAKLPCKDANECLMEGHVKAAVNACMFNAAPAKNSRIIWGDSIHDEAKEQTPLGELTWPWKGLNDMTRNIRYGETIYIGAGVN